MLYILHEDDVPSRDHYAVIGHAKDIDDALEIAHAHPDYLPYDHGSPVAVYDFDDLHPDSDEAACIREYHKKQ